jgi:protein AFG1
MRKMNRNSIAACTKCVHTISRATASRAHTVSASSRVHSVNRAVTISRYGSSRALSNSLYAPNKSYIISASSTEGSIRSFATAHATSASQQSVGDGDGPIYEYERRVNADLLRDDPHQRSMSESVPLLKRFLDWDLTDLTSV